MYGSGLTYAHNTQHEYMGQGAQERSNDRVTILEPIFPIASKRRVTHYPRVTKKETQTRLTAITINQTNKLLL